MDDPLFRTVWRDTFLPYDSLRVPWKVILGNHDYEVRGDTTILRTPHATLGHILSLSPCPGCMRTRTLSIL